MRQLPPPDRDPNSATGSEIPRDGNPLPDLPPRPSPLSRAPYIDAAADPQFTDDPAGASLLEYWRIIQRRKGTVCLIAFLGTLAGLLFTLPQTPVYQASTTLEILGINEDFMRLREVNPTSTSASYQGESDVQTQVGIIQSPALVARTVNRIALKTQPPAPTQNRLESWRKALNLTPAAPPDAAAAPLRATADSLKARARVNTRLVDLTCDSTDPRLAAQFLNTLTSEFIEQNLESRWQTTQHTGEWLSRQMEEFKIKLEKSEDALQAYSRQTGLVFTQEKDNVAEEKLKQVQEELSRAQADRIAKQSRYELARGAPAETLGEVLDSQGMKDLQVRLVDLRREFAELSSAFTAKHPKVRNVRAQLAALEAGMVRERSNIVTRIRNDFESAQRREKLLAADYAAHVKLISAQADKVAHYGILRREVDMNRQLYENMLQRLKEAGIASALRASNIRIVDPAQRPKEPYKPRLILNTLLGLFAGLFLGIGFVVFRERADRTVQNPGDTSLYLGLPELGVVPSAAMSRHQGLLPRRRAVTPDAGSSRELVTLNRRHSAVAESFHVTLISILFSTPNGSHPKVLVVSSAAPKEGKTTVCANLAVTLAEIHHRVLVIDADVRKPRMHRI
ncbi:MAG: hypothetical protein IT160_04865, partial [Bryobacterales bacterium]|nr:hypothetical protein [Bryobacterales bacterium]